MSVSGELVITGATVVTNARKTPCKIEPIIGGKEAEDNAQNESDTPLPDVKPGCGDEQIPLPNTEKGFSKDVE